MESNKNAGKRNVELTRIFKVMLRFWWVVIIVALIAVLAAGALKIKDRRDAAAQRMYYQDMQLYIQKEEPQQNTNLGVNYSALLVSDKVLQQIEKDVKGMDVKQIRDAILFKQDYSSKVLLVAVLTNDKDNCSAIMDGLIKYGFGNVKTVTGDDQLIITDYPFSPVEKHKQPNTILKPTGVVFSNSTDRYTLTDWPTYVNEQLGKTAILKALIKAGVAGGIVAIVFLFIYAILSTKIDYKEDLFGLKYIGSYGDDENGVVAKILGRITKKEDNAAIIVRTVGNGASSKALTKELAQEFLASGYKVAVVDSTEVIDGAKAVSLEKTSSKDYKAEIKKYKEKNDFVLFDGEVIDNKTNLQLVQNECDDTVILVAKGTCKSADVENMISESEGAGSQFVGSVLVPGVKKEKK